MRGAVLTLLFLGCFKNILARTESSSTSDLLHAAATTPVTHGHENKGEDFHTVVRKAMETIEAANSLEFGNGKVECGIHEEYLRKALEKRFLGEIMLRYIVPPAAKAMVNEQLKATLKDLAAIKGPFCNTFKNLECAPVPGHHHKTNKCYCQCSKSLDRPFNFKSMFHREEETDSCVVSDGYMCAPEEVVTMVNHELLFGAYPRTKLTCGKKRSCIIRGSGGVKCDAAGLAAEMRRLSNLHDTPETDTAYKLAVAAEGICICKGTTIQQSLALIICSIAIFIINFN